MSKTVMVGACSRRLFIISFCSMPAVISIALHLAQETKI